MTPLGEGLSVVVPVWNEAENIEPLVREIVTALRGLPQYEIVYVDDGSDDATPRELARLAGEIPRLRVIRHVSRCGQSTAIVTGVFAARHRWVATLDGDGQNDPADIPRLLERLRSAQPADNLHMVVGWRTRRQDNWIRRLSSKVANAVRRGLLGDDTPDTGCGLKVFRRETFLRLPYFDHMHRFLPALVRRHGGAVESLPVNHRPRQGGRSKYGLHDRLWVGIADLIGVLWLMRRTALTETTEPGSNSTTA
jgi:dolichol-phosphate mannosyltransferase